MDCDSAHRDTERSSTTDADPTGPGPADSSNTSAAAQVTDGSATSATDDQDGRADHSPQQTFDGRGSSADGRARGREPDPVSSTEGVGTHPTRRGFLTTVGAGAGITLAGCLGSSEETITVGYQPFGTPYWSELVVKHAEFTEEYLPDGYTLEWQSALQGTIIGNRMISGENQIGYNGDMPTLIALAQDDEPISKVALSQWSWGQQCNAVITPRGSDVEEPADLDGADVGATSGACSHRALLTIQEERTSRPTW